MQLGKTIVKIRKEYELTQEDFAKKFKKFLRVFTENG